MTDIEKNIKSGQEQVVAAWVGLINQLRLDALINALHVQDANLENAMISMDRAMAEIENVILTNRGGEKGLHGFIAEIAECGFGNAKSYIHGGEKFYEWINSNGPDDIFRLADGKHIQMKFVQGNGKLSIDAVFKHLQTYPDYIEQDGSYQIPKDFYDVVKRLYDMPREEAGKLAKGGGLTYRRWKLVHDYIDGSGLKIEDLEPSDFEYKEVQVNSVAKSMGKRRNQLVEEDRNTRAKVYDKSKPTFGEGAKVTVVAAVLEGVATFVLAVKRHLGEGRSIRDITQEEWQEIAKESGYGLAKGGVRGAVTYVLNNYTATPAAVASSLVTASFGIAEQANKFRCGELTEVQFIEASETVCLDASVSALASFMGQAAIPVPILGAFIGNTVGCFAYQLAKDSLSVKEEELLKAYREEQAQLDADLSARYGELLESYRQGISEYIAILGKAFSPNPYVALEGSIQLSLELGLTSDDVLKTEEEIDSFFLS